MKLKSLKAAAAVAVVAAGTCIATAPAANAQEACQTVDGARMCVDVQWTPGTKVYYGHASIRDVDGGPNLNVAVTNIRVQRWSPSAGWVNVTELYDYDGFFDVRDAGTTDVVRPCNFPTQPHRTVAYFQWNGARTGSATVATIGHGMSGC